MFRNLPRYDHYAPNDSPWLGELPSHWRTQRTKSLLAERSQKGYPDEPLLAATQSRGVILKSDYGTRTVTATKDLHLLKLVEVGDFVISLRSFQGGIERCHHRGIISPAYTVLTANSEGYRDYLTYLFKSKPFVDSLTLSVTGIREGQNIDYATLAVDRLPVPTCEEQAAIVKYLAHANARIDKAIAAKRRLVSLLGELAASIQHSIVTAVTEGDETISIGQSSSLVQTGPFGSQLHADEYVSEGVPVINPSHIGPTGIFSDPAIGVSAAKAAELRRHRFEAGDIVLARRGDLGRSAVVLAEQVGWLCGTGSLTVRLRRDLWNPEYFRMAFSSKENKERLELLSVGSTMANLNASQVSRLRMQRPPLLRQDSAVREARRAQVDHVSRVTTVTREIKLLQEFRARLVADVVTGQVDVRAVAAGLPDEPEAAIDLADESREGLSGVIEGANA